MGGLGNQMFQYAAGRSLALRLQDELKLDLSFLNQKITDVKITRREFELDGFNLDVKIVTDQEVFSFLKWEINFFYKRLKRVLPFVTSKKVFRENQYQFNETFFFQKKNCLLIGYWQSEKYFARNVEQIRKDFGFIDKPNLVLKEIEKEITSCNSVSMHIRRGDYMANPETAKYHPVCSIEYYKDAAELIAQKIPSPVFYVFSDDIKWAKENIRLNFEIRFIAPYVGKKDIDDMRLISLCKHNIIANSSFSWWGAWLSRNENKTVIAPLKWFNDPAINTSDLIPPNWIRI